MNIQKDDYRTARRLLENYLWEMLSISQTAMKNYVHSTDPERPCFCTDDMLKLAADGTMFEAMWCTGTMSLCEDTTVHSGTHIL